MEGVEAEDVGREEGTAGVSGGFLEEAAMVQVGLVDIFLDTVFPTTHPLPQVAGIG